VIDDAALRARRLAAQRTFYEEGSRVSEGARVVRFPGGVQAAITPARADRSLFNGVVYEDPDALVAALPALADCYDDAGIEAWTVWALEGHGDMAPAFEAAGHVRDGTPCSMGAALADLDLAARREIDLVEDVDWNDLAEINEAAYYESAGGAYMGPVMNGFAATPARGYVARADGRPAACLAVLDEGGDAYVTFVATRREAQGRGLCGGLLRHALRDALARGATTTTLEATTAGEPVYAHMGYRDLGRLVMWERRKRQDSA
jgi:ribosomal protein S18 acetylase RimI-like enzyme